MRKNSSISSALAFSSALFFSACDDGLEQEKSKSDGYAIELSENVTVDRSGQTKGQVDAKDKQSKEITDVVDLADGFSVEGSKQEVLRVLDLSLNFEEIKPDKSPYTYRSYQLKLLPGIFESEELASSVEMEAHFEGPHNENKKKR